MFVYVNTDGGCIDNTVKPPGLASASYVAKAADLACTYLGSRSDTFNGTNNDAEYRGILLALEDLPLYPDVEGVQIRCDSELIVSQISGVFRCKDPKMKEYLQKVKRLIDELPYPCSIKHIRRDANQEADWLCTCALYRGPKTDRLAEIPTKVSRDRLKKEAA